MALRCIEARGLPSFGTQYLPITTAHLHAHSLVLHNARMYIYNTYSSTHAIQIQRIAQLHIQIQPSFKKGPTCLHAIPAYYTPSSACLAIACAILSIAQCTQCILYTFQLSLFFTAHITCCLYSELIYRHTITITLLICILPACTRFNIHKYSSNININVYALHGH